MVDFHTHILPAMDDGSAGIRESLDLLRMERSFGVDTVILTPHFYADHTDVPRFLAKRDWSVGKLRKYMGEGAPDLRLGAEVQFFQGIENMERLTDLCIEGTNLLLLEMPFAHWTDRTVYNLMDLNNSGEVRIILAHIERYIKDQRENLWAELRKEGILTQVNTGFFGILTRKKAMSMMEQDFVNLIGSDCHNMTKRKPTWNLVPGEAREIAARNARRILNL